MAALWNKGMPLYFCPVVSIFLLSSSLWPPYGIGQAILPCGSFFMAARCNRPLYFCPLPSFFYLSMFFSRLISATTDWMSTILLHMAWP